MRVFTKQTAIMAVSTVIAGFAVTLAPFLALSRPVTIVDAKCQVDQTKANACQYGNSNACPQPNNSYFYCSASSVPEECITNPGTDCYFFPNAYRGQKMYRGTQTNVYDANGNPINCTGRPDVCQ